MSAPTLLAALVAALLLPLLTAVLRERSLATLARRNTRRRRGEAVLVVAGAMLGTAIITSSFVVGDIVDGSITDVARTQLGPIDLTLTPGDPADLDRLVAEVVAADLPEVDGVLPARRAQVALEAGRAGGHDQRALPAVGLLEVDVEVARHLGADAADTGLAPLPADALAHDGLVLNERTAERLGVGPGAPVRLHAYGTTRDLEVTAVLEEVGLAGFTGGLLAPGTLDAMAADSPVAAAPPDALVLVSLTGGVFDTRELSPAAVTGLAPVVAAVPGTGIDPVKADLLDDAEQTGAAFTELFSTIGSFSVLAGILLLVNLFVMLAEERKTELGMLRALGFTRGRLARVFALEGAWYAAVAAVLGTLAGVGIGWGVARAAGAIYGMGEQGLGFGLVVEPRSLVTGGLTGLAISLATIWLTSLRIARLNVIRALRDLPEPPKVGVRPRTLVLGGLGTLAGAALSVAGLTTEAPIPLLLGVPIAALAATPLLRRLLPERPARIVASGAALGWGVGALQLLPGGPGDAELTAFVVQGVVLVAGAVALIASLDTLWLRLVDLLAARGRGLALRLGVAYPLARRARTSMLLSMFALVVFTMTFLASMSTLLTTQTDALTAEVRGGFDLVVDSNATNPATTGQLRAVDGVGAVAGLSRAVVRFEAPFLDEPRSWPISGFDADLVAGGPPTLLSRDAAYPTDLQAYRAVLDDPSLTIVADTFLQLPGASGQRVGVGDTIGVLDPVSGTPRELTVVGVGGVDWLGNGALVAREVTRELLGDHEVVARHHLAVDDRVDADALAAELDLALLGNGGTALTFTGLVGDGLRQEHAFLSLLQAFLGLGLLVGIAGLGVVMVRAVRERRQAIGMLRAIGTGAGTVRAALLVEAGGIALQGSLIGAGLGLVTARQVLLGTDAFGAVVGGFTIPWAGLAGVVALPVLAALLASAWPAARAAATHPAVALRTAD